LNLLAYATSRRADAEPGQAAEALQILEQAAEVIALPLINQLDRNNLFTTLNKACITFESGNYKGSL